MNVAGHFEYVSLVPEVRKMIIGFLDKRRDRVALQRVCWLFHVDDPGSMTELELPSPSMDKSFREFALRVLEKVIDADIDLRRPENVRYCCSEFDPFVGVGSGKYYQVSLHWEGKRIVSRDTRVKYWDTLTATNGTRPFREEQYQTETVQFKRPLKMPNSDDDLTIPEGLLEIVDDRPIETKLDTKLCYVDVPRPPGAVALWKLDIVCNEPWMFDLESVSWDLDTLKYWKGDLGLYTS